MGSKGAGYRSGANVSSIGSCCMCVPLRFGTALICMYNLVYGFLCLVNIFSGDIRFQSGGYDPSKARLQVWFGALLIPMSLVGLLGIYDEKLSMLRAFGISLCVKAFVALVVFAFDMRLLTRCKTWSSQKAGIFHHQYPAMEAISQKGLCTEAQVSYIFGFVLDFGLTCHFIFTVFKCCRRLEETPAGVIRFKGTPDSEDPPELFDDRIGVPLQYVPDPYAKSKKNS
eukprot:CAMPEP_0178446112 /NCGR_PEP_ID=MMETSP0689_2-20121128/40599_1 /TAXON_ID=160604 /ORGANISM="Amphidinium massartii, Strain CS-259" /LENGTH=226 /DNA_ID=CAMNT_0020070853 /DNA_START=80 /DNA_END=757 /DNA_ORIENTATION=+